MGVKYPRTNIRDLFEAWIKSTCKTASLDCNHNGEYIVAGLQDRYLAFIAGWANHEFFKDVK